MRSYLVFGSGSARLVAVFLGLAVVALWQPRARAADNPVDALNEKLAARVAELGRKPQGVLPLLELWDNWDDATPKRTRGLLEKLAAGRRLAPPLRVLAGTMLAEAQARLGDAAALSAGFEQLGYVTHWRVIGPFDNEGKRGFDREAPPEQKRLEAADPDASYPGRERPVRWRGYPDVVRGGYVSFAAILRPRENACGFAETFVHAQHGRPLSLWIGSGGANKVYWNGREVLRDAAYRAPSPDRAATMVRARTGPNRLLVKVCNTNAAWGFQLRLGEADGSVASGLSVEIAYPSAGWSPQDDAVPPSAAPMAPLAAFERALVREPTSPAAAAELARYLSRTGSDDPDERRAAQLAKRAVLLAPSIENLRLAMGLSEQRSERLRLADQAAQLYPEHPALLVLRARELAAGPVPKDALPLLERVREGSESWPEAQQLKAAVLRSTEPPGVAVSVLERTVQRVGETARLLRQLADAGSAAGAQEQALEARRRLLLLRFDDADARRVLISQALQRGETNAVHAHIEALLALAPGSLETLLQAAALYDASGRDDLALATYRTATELGPESSDALLAYARALLRAQHPELAAKVLTRALSIEPQGKTARQLLEQIKLRPRADEAYAITTERILAARGKSPGYPTTVLMDLTVNTVFDNGLGSSFRQHAVQVHDTQGAFMQRTFGIQFDPDSQRVAVSLARVYRNDGRTLEAVRIVEQSLSDPSYRTAYDPRELVVVFPELTPGDVVELRYRIDDIAHRNLFVDYYGDLHAWQGASPVVRSEYVLITPKARPFYLNEPGLAGLRHEQQIAGDRRIDHYVAENVPAIVSETGMPGLTEISPYLHVSTYKHWEDVGRWYWGLIEDQLIADESLKRTVHELTEGALDLRTKVERIQNWVVGRTHYAELKFGTHGYRPYRAPLIAQRGFGDSQDKAVLMYTMLREAGIDGRVGLVRTRQSGAIGDEPASLAAFDHAISYVPALDLYLDATVEHGGSRELPVQDQGVNVLLVGPASAELRKTPVLDAEHNNKRSRSLQIDLAADGSAQVAAEELVAGAEAAHLREYYQEKDTRAERFEISLRRTFPGMKLKEQQFSKLGDLEQPVRYSYRVRAPRLAQWDGDQLQLKPSVLEGLMQSMARLSRRRHALDLLGTRVYVEERKVRLPTGMRIPEVPAGGEASSPFGRLKLGFTKENGTITARTEFTVMRDRVELSEYPEFRRWIEAADQLLKQRIALRMDREVK